MKKLIFILLVLVGFMAKAQFPSQQNPTQFSTGWFKQGWNQSDSGHILANRLPNFTPRFPGTTILYQQNGVDSSVYYWNGGRWLKLSQFDSTSLSNRINLKQNILSNTTASGDTLLIGNSIKRVQNDYGLTFSTNATKILMFIDTLGSNHVVTTSQLKDTAAAIRAAIGSGTGLTSVGLSMPSAFTVTGSPLTTNGTISVSGAGTALEYVKANGTIGTTDTGMIPNFYLKVRGLLSGTSPISYNSTTGAISIPNADITGTKGAATFNSAYFTTNGSGLIGLTLPVSAGSCTGCTLNIGADGRITSYADGAGGATNNANIGSGYRWLNGITQELRTAANSPTITWDSVSTANTLTAKVDTSIIATQYDLTQIQTFANNGLSKDADTIQLGGVLVKATHISGGVNAYALQVDSSSSISFFSGLEYVSSGIGSFIQMSDSVMNIGASSATDFTSFVFSPTRIRFTAADGTGSSGDVWTNTGSGYGHWAPASGGSATLNNIGAGFRWAATPGGNIKTVSQSNTILWDSTSTANTLTAKVDTSVVATQYDLTQISTPTWPQTLATGRTFIGNDSAIFNGNSFNFKNIKFGINTSKFIYNRFGSDDTSVVVIKGDVSGNGRGLRYIMSATDSSGAVVMNMDHTGRMNLFDYANQGSVMVLYNTVTGGEIAGHYAFGAANSSGNLNTINTIFGHQDVATASAVDSRMSFGYCDGCNTVPGYSQPNKEVQLSKGGLVLPGISLQGVTYINFNGTSLPNWTNTGRAGLIQAAQQGIFWGNSTDLIFSSNGYYDGAWKYVDNGKASNQLMYDGEIWHRTTASGSAEGTITWAVPLKSTYISGGAVGMGGNITATSGSLSGATMIANPSSVLIGTSTDNGVGKLQVNGKITVSTHVIASNSDSALIWDRSTNEYKVAKINGSGNTIYTGDGTLSGARVVTGSNNNLTFSDLNTLKTSFDLFVQARADGGVPYSTLIDAGGFGRWQLGYTPVAGLYSKGSAIMIDTNNNIGLGTFLPSSAPLYSIGNSAYANGLQSQAGNFYRIDQITSDQTIGLTQNFFRIDATSGNITITLPAASAAFGGVMGIDYIFKRIDNSGNTVTIQRAGSDTIDGATSFALTTQWESKNLRATSSSTWNIY